MTDSKPPEHSEEKQPPPPAETDDGATAYMPDPPPPTADDGATAYMPPPNAEADDGATTYMPNSPPDADDGATAYMPTDAPSPASVRPTVKSPKLPDEVWEQNIVLQERYRLRRILGKGGFGAAYLAEDLTLKRGCVVKQMLSREGVSRAEEEINRQNFEREASLLVQLNHPGHPNIPEIFDYFSDDEGSYLVMKYIEGRSLQQLMADAAGQIPWRDATRHLIDVCSALNYMHTHGQEPVLHRDIKPANILLGDDGRVWLVDFGLAQVKPLKSTAELSSSQAAGSIGYTPFEQWLGESVPASDVYAAGVTLHYLITGADPLAAYRDEDGKTRVNIEKLRDLHGRLDPLRRLDRSLPRELEEIVAQATVAEPEQRLTALQFQHQLEVLISGVKNAALFTFKNGQSARSIPQLVDLCEQNRVEAQGYLYRGDFARWFTLINRNDLADAAHRAVQHSAKGKDALERFLKLIMPNIFFRRLWKAGKNVARVGAQLAIILLAAAALVIVLGTLATRWLVQRTIANYNWNYYALTLDEPNVFSQDYLSGVAYSYTQAYLDSIEIDPQAGQPVMVRATMGNLGTLNIPVDLQLEGAQPQVTLSQVNGIPFYWITDNLTQGLNQGIAGALANAPIDITGLEVTDNAVIIDVAKSDRAAYAPPTPIPGASPTPTATPFPTATPRGSALLAVFNDLEHPISIDIEGEQWLVPARDTKVIERAPGTYRYEVRYAETGQLAARGTRTWDYRAYKWRIGVEGDTFE